MAVKVEVNVGVSIGGAKVFVEAAVKVGVFVFTGVFVALSLRGTVEVNRGVDVCSIKVKVDVGVGNKGVLVAVDVKVLVGGAEVKVGVLVGNAVGVFTRILVGV